jgi:transposase-like protein
MINIKVTKRRPRENAYMSEMVEKHTFKCPNCGSEVTYFYQSPLMCRSCLKDLPDVYRLSVDDRFRKIWHNGISTTNRGILSKE